LVKGTGSMFPPDVRQQFDLVGFDPRGVGESSPVTCGLIGDERLALPAPQYKPETGDRDSAARAPARTLLRF